jgi:hypothetical protein
VPSIGVKLEAVKLYLVALKKNERQDETPFIIKIGGNKLSESKLTDRSHPLISRLFG